MVDKNLSSYGYGLKKPEKNNKIILYILASLIGVLFIVVLFIIIFGIINTPSNDTDNGDITPPDDEQPLPSGDSCVSNEECAAVYGSLYICGQNGLCVIADENPPSGGGGGDGGVDDNNGGGDDGSDDGGITGFFAKFTGWAAGGANDIYYDDGKVAVGTNNFMDSALTIEDGLVIGNDTDSIKVFTKDSTARILFRNNDTSKVWGMDNDGLGKMRFYDELGAVWYLDTVNRQAYINDRLNLTTAGTIYAQNGLITGYHGWNIGTTASPNALYYDTSTSNALIGSKGTVLIAYNWNGDLTDKSFVVRNGTSGENQLKINQTGVFIPQQKRIGNGTLNAYACLDAAGRLYRSSTACA